MKFTDIADDPELREEFPDEVEHYAARWWSAAQQLASVVAASVKS